ncbi:MAG: phage tail tape measure protein [Rhizobiales bacterium]|nr:phage tail tape measure protein [Hyphomicrobiales bacterium]
MDEFSDDLRFSVEVDTAAAQRALADMSRLGQSFAQHMSRAFVDVAVKGQSLEDRLRRLALSLSDLALKAAFRPLENAIGSVFGQLLAGAAPFAMGGVPGRPGVTAFASGGVVSSPVAFSFGRGELGIAGERGAEAILPLRRGSDGRLGVAAGSGAGTVVNVSISTPDVEGFRRSEGQLTALLSRAVARGRRNL